MHSMLSMLTLSIHSHTIYSHVMVCMLMQLTQLNYNIDSNMKSLNYNKIQFEALIYFELQ